MKKILPILDNQIPTTISYSAASNFDFCAYYYLLSDILRLKPWKNSPDTIFGTYIHNAVQDVLSGKATIEESIKLFRRKWKKFTGLYKNFLSKDDFEIIDAGCKIIENVHPALEKQFGKFKVLAVEEKISINIDNYPQKFKGYIDIVLLLESGKRVIIDFKTSASAFFFEKFKETIKDYQLTLYKNFYCQVHTINPDDVETYFVVLEKNKNSKNSVVPIRISSGKIKITNALKWLNFALSAINRKKFYRNFFSCYKFGKDHPCVFKDTYCRKNK